MIGEDDDDGNGKGALVESSGGIETDIWRPRCLGKVCVIFAAIGLANEAQSSTPQRIDARGPEILKNLEFTWPNLSPV
jgi:hypothetical protein